MAEVPRRARTVPILLETRHTELGRLIHKHHIAVRPTVLTPTNDPE